MSKAYWETVVHRAADMLWSDSPPTYAEMDCQKYIKTCVQQAGGAMQFAGSNDMYRNACTKIMTIPEAQASGELHSGWLLFIVEQDGREPAQYQGDGKGNASHVGLYMDLRNAITGEYAEVAHSSANKGGVVASTLQNAWTHCGPAKAIDYGNSKAGDPPQENTQGDDQAPAPGLVWGTVEASSVNMRKRPGGEYMLKIPNGARIPIYEQKTYNGDRVGRTEYANHNGLYSGWVVLNYVSLETVQDSAKEEKPGEEAPDLPWTEPQKRNTLEITAFQGKPLTSEQLMNLVNDFAASGYSTFIRGME